MSPERFTRRNLPHWYVPGASHFVTYRLANTLPADVRQDLRSKQRQLLRKRPDSKLAAAAYRIRVHKILFAAYDAYLDQCKDITWLADPTVAAVVRENLYHHDGCKYELQCYCIMPNHVHVLLKPNWDDLARVTGGNKPASTADVALSVQEAPIGESPDAVSPLTRIMHSLKSFTANRANEILGRQGAFWQKESYDHWVRDDSELQRIVDYIRMNPVQAGLCTRPEEWLWASCRDRFLIDGDLSGWLIR